MWSTIRVRGGAVGHDLKLLCIGVVRRRTTAADEKTGVGVGNEVPDAAGYATTIVSEAARGERFQTPGRLEIAQPRDAVAIVDMLRRTLDPRYHRFSLYRAASSARHLEKRLASGDGGGQRVRTVRIDSQLVGFTLSDVLPDRLHLGYIGVVPESSGKGVGGQLLRELIEAAREHCCVVTLDAFASNTPAIDWYRRHDFSEVSRSWSMEIDLARLPQEPAHGGALNLDEALAEEMAQGFSSVEINAGLKRLRIGIIDGTVARALETDGISEARVAQIVRGALPERRTLQFFGRPRPSIELPVLTVEESVRMRLELARGGTEVR
ncbi:MAG: N-acetyltransferase [Gemmatimonadaceae bacterium]